MSHSYTTLLYHIVFATKERAAILDTEIRPKLYNYIAATIRNLEGECLAINGISDHIHILVKLHPDHSLSSFMREIKAHSSKWIHKTYAHMHNFAWQAGYGAFTVSRSQRERVYLYIKNQEIHHQRKSFPNEFTTLLKSHQINYQEKYLWG